MRVLIPLVCVVLLTISLSGCLWRVPQTACDHPQGGFYNAYFNRDVTILYKRPSSKFGCWLTSCGWSCVSK